MAAVRLALVGAGRWGRNYIRTIASLDGVELVAVASRNAETAGLAPPGCRIVEDWRDVTDAADVEGVIVASPPGTHAEILVAALARDKAVLVEKPVVMSRRDAAQVRAALGERPAVILVDHTHLFHPAFRALRREAGSLGPVRAIKSSAGNHGPYRRDASVLWDWAPHDLAMCRALVSGAARVERARRAEVRVIDSVAAERLVLDLTFGTTPANVTVSTLDARHRSFAAQFDSCTLVFRDFVDDKLVRFAPGVDVATGAGTAVAVGSELPLSRAVVEFAERIRAKNTDRDSIDLGLTVVELIADAEAMLATGGRQLAE
jgi:predicted dehydrogenase